MRRRRICALAILLAAAALYLFENSGGTLALLVAAAVLPAVSALALALRRGELSLKISLPPEVERGERAVGHAEFINGGRLPVARAVCVLSAENLFTGERVEREVSAAVRGRSAKAVEFSFESARAGLCALSAGEIVEYDALGLFRRRVAVSAEVEMLVAPRTVAVEAELLPAESAGADGEEYSSERAGSDPGETFAVREYAPGDSPRQIHWKLSEKVDRTMARDFGLPVVSDALALYEGGGEDECLDFFCSLVTALAAAGTAHTVGYVSEGGLQLVEVACEDDADAAIRRMLSSKGEGGGAAEYLAARGRRAYARIALVAAEPPPELDELCRAGAVTAFLLRGGERAPSDCAVETIGGGNFVEF